MERYSNLPYVNVPETIGTPPFAADTKDLLIRVAERIIKDTSRGWIKSGEPSGRLFESVDPGNPGYILSCGYTDWKYWNGVIYIGMMRLAQLTGQSVYSDYPVFNLRFGFDNLPHFRKLFEERIPSAPWHQFFRLDRLDDCGAMGAALIECYPGLSEKYILDQIHRTTGYILNRQDRLPDGTFIRKRFGRTSMWADDLYMCVPFLVRMFRFTGESRYLDEAVQQACNFYEKLFDPVKGLYHHTYCMEMEVHGVAYWGRANGWVVLAMCDLIDAMPESAARKEMIQRLFSHLTGLSRHQSANGMWRQLIDKDDAWPESSSTAMFVYGIAHAVNSGWIDDMYASIAVEGWKALTGCVTPEGEFLGVSEGFNIHQDLPYYYNRPIEKGGAHGLGALLLAGTEMALLKEYRDCIWC